MRGWDAYEVAAAVLAVVGAVLMVCCFAAALAPLRMGSTPGVVLLVASGVYLPVAALFFWLAP